jgi:hypothetical protein
MESAVVNETDLLRGEGFGCEHGVHEITIVEALERIDYGIIDLNGAGDGVQEGT